MHYVENQFSIIAGRRVENTKAVCGHIKEHYLDLSDAASLIDCKACQNWIIKHEKDAHKLKLIRNAWKGSAASKPFWNEKDKRWDILDD